MQRLNLDRFFLWRKRGENQHPHWFPLFVTFIWANLEKKKPGDLRWFATSGWSRVWYSSLSSTADVPRVARVDTVQRRYATLLCHTINATRETKNFIAFSSCCNITSFYIAPLSFFFFFPQQSITTMPEERRNCRCRLETPCTYWRNMKVRLGWTSVTFVFSQMSAAVI